MFLRSIYVKGSHFPPTVPWPTMTSLSLSIPLAGDVSSEKCSTEMEFWKSDVILSSIVAEIDDSDVNGESFKDAARKMQVRWTNHFRDITKWHQMLSNFKKSPKMQKPSSWSKMKATISSAYQCDTMTRLPILYIWPFTAKKNCPIPSIRICKSSFTI